MQDGTGADGSLNQSRPASRNETHGTGSHSSTVEAGPSTLPREPSVKAQAEPLPLKRGEIGYQEPKSPEEDDAEHASALDTITPLPAVHPADRGSASLTATPSQSSPTTTAAADSASTHTACSAHSKLFKLLKPKRIPSYYGVRLTTTLLFALHLALLCGTIAGWALIVQHLSASSDDSGNAFGGSSAIFVHVAFGVACLAQLIFLERRIFRIRAERYCYKHGGLPMHMPGRNGDMSIGFAPWSRPPLPTYAAALAQSGVGTGDVEDSIIAIPPPPAYGHTRGSTLLLSGFINDTLRAQRVEARERARERESHDGSLLRASLASAASRPVSYRSHDEEWEERCDAMRAVVLEETLARLEETRPGV